MSLNAKKIPMSGGGKRGPEQANIENGTYPARVVQILDMGLQPQRPFQGIEKPPAQMINLTYEFLDEFCVDEDGNEDTEKPRWLSETIPLYNLEVELAKSTKRYNALDPDCVHEGDFSQLINSCGMVTVTNSKAKNDKVYTNVVSVATMRAKEAAKAPELVNPPKVFLLDEPDLEVLGSLPQWLQDKIKENLQYEGSVLQKALEGGSPAPKSAPKPKAEKPKAEPKVEEEVDDEGW